MSPLNFQTLRISLMRKPLTQQTILITGASSGIGRELAWQLAKKQNRLILVARRQELLQELVDALPHTFEEHLIFKGDVSNQKQVQSICESLLQQKINMDVLILNAGRGGGFNAKDIDLENFRQQIDVNFWGAVNFVKYLVPPMIERGGGIIAVNGSLAGYRGMPKAAPYSASKGALMNFIESLRIDLRKHHIQCTLISPGFVKTPLTDLNEFYMPFMISVEKAASIIIRGLERGRAEIHFPLRLSLVAKFSRLLPPNMYVWIMQASRKPKD